MSNSTVGDAAIAVVRRNTEEVQGKGNWDLFEELFADDFVDHTPQPGTTPDKAGVRVLYKGLRAAFPDFTPEIHWQVAAGDLVTTYKTYHGTHQGEFLGIPATGKKVCAGRDIVTIEGISGPGGALHPVQQSFIDHDAFQCGYCTPGQILSAIACIQEGHAPDEASVREWMSGNICRCAAYPQITAAVLDAAGKMKD
jgi:hypothetical protein